MYTAYSLLQRFSKAQTDNSPKAFRQPIDPDYIFFNRKRACDFLTTQNVLKHVHKYKRNLIPSRLKISKQNGGSTASITTTNHSPSLFNKERSIKAKEAGISPYPKQKFDPTRIFAEYRGVYNKLLEAGANQHNLAQFHPLSPDHNFTQAVPEKDRVHRVIKNQSHKIYGIDHINLRKINLMLKSKSEAPLLDELSVTAKADYLKKTELEKKEQKKFLMYEKEEQEHNKTKKESNIITNKTKNYNVYENNPLLDDFQFAEPDPNELQNMLLRITQPNRDDDEDDDIYIPETNQKPKEARKLLNKAKCVALSKLRPKFRMPTEIRCEQREGI